MSEREWELRVAAFYLIYGLLEGQVTALIFQLMMGWCGFQWDGEQGIFRIM